MTMTQTMNHGFYGRLKAAFPSQVIIDVTEICNLACTHCPHPDFKKSEYYSARSLTPDLNAKMIDEIAQNETHVQYVRYTSEGEPLVHPKIFEMLSYAKSRLQAPAIALTTNGKRMPPKYVAQILETQIDLVDISIDAFLPETYAKIRVGGDLAVTRANVQNLLKQRVETKSPLKVVVSYIEQPENVNETADFQKFWKDQGADYVVVRKLHSGAGAIESVKQKMWNETPPDSRRACVYPWERIVLNPRGFLSFCPADWTHGSTMVDFRSNTVKDVWMGPIYEALRQAHLSNDYSCHKFCGQCPDWKTTSWPGVSRGYAEMVEEFRREGPNTVVG